MKNKQIALAAVLAAAVAMVGVIIIPADSNSVDAADGLEDVTIDTFVVADEYELDGKNITFAENGKLVVENGSVLKFGSSLIGMTSNFQLNGVGEDVIQFKAGSILDLGFQQIEMSSETNVSLNGSLNLSISMNYESFFSGSASIDAVVDVSDNGVLGIGDVDIIGGSAKEMQVNGKMALTDTYAINATVSINVPEVKWVIEDVVDASIKSISSSIKMAIADGSVTIDGDGSKGAKFSIGSVSIKTLDIDKLLESIDFSQLMGDTGISDILGQIDFSDILGDMDLSEIMGDLDFSEILSDMDFSEITDSDMDYSDLFDQFEDFDMSNIIDELKNIDISDLASKIPSFSIEASGIESSVYVNGNTAGGIEVSAGAKVAQSKFTITDDNYSFDIEYKDIAYDASVKIAALTDGPSSDSDADLSDILGDMDYSDILGDMDFSEITSGFDISSLFSGSIIKDTSVDYSLGSATLTGTYDEEKLTVNVSGCNIDCKMGADGNFLLSDSMKSASVNIVMGDMDATFNLSDVNSSLKIGSDQTAGTLGVSGETSIGFGVSVKYVTDDVTINANLETKGLGASVKYPNDAGALEASVKLDSMKVSIDCKDVHAHQFDAAINGVNATLVLPMDGSDLTVTAKIDSITAKGSLPEDVSLIDVLSSYIQSGITKMDINASGIEVKYDTTSGAIASYITSLKATMMANDIDFEYEIEDWKIQRGNGSESMSGKKLYVSTSPYNDVVQKQSNLFEDCVFVDGEIANGKITITNEYPDGTKAVDTIELGSAGKYTASGHKLQDPYVAYLDIDCTYVLDDSFVYFLDLTEADVSGQVYLSYGCYITHEGGVLSCMSTGSYLSVTIKDSTIESVTIVPADGFATIKPYESGLEFTLNDDSTVGTVTSYNGVVEAVGLGKEYNVTIDGEVKKLRMGEYLILDTPEDREGQVFIGYSDGYAMYDAGESYVLLDAGDVTITSVWSITEDKVRIDGSSALYDAKDFLGIKVTDITVLKDAGEIIASTKYGDITIPLPTTGGDIMLIQSSDVISASIVKIDKPAEHIASVVKGQDLYTVDSNVSNTSFSFTLKGKAGSDVVVHAVSDSGVVSVLQSSVNDVGNDAQVTISSSDITSGMYGFYITADGQSTSGGSGGMDMMLIIGIVVVLAIVIVAVVLLMKRKGQAA